MRIRVFSPSPSIIHHHPTLSSASVPLALRSIPPITSSHYPNIAPTFTIRLSQLLRAMSSSRWSPRRSAHASTEAPWKSTFLSHIAKLESPEFVFASLAINPVHHNVSWVPRLRYCIYRGMWAELPENKHNDAPKNERIYESDLPTFTTDVRMGKIDGIFQSGWGRGGPEEIEGSGGGGAVEAVWWIKDTGTQWRIKGQAFVVAPDVEGKGKQSEGIEELKSEVGERMRKVQEGDWSWGKELTAHFGNCSPKMRGKHGFRH